MKQNVFCSLTACLTRAVWSVLQFAPVHVFGEVVVAGYESDNGSLCFLTGRVLQLGATDLWPASVCQSALVNKQSFKVH